MAVVPVCEVVAGGAGFDYEVREITDEVPGLVEVMWFLVIHLEWLRFQLDPPG